VSSGVLDAEVLEFERQNEFIDESQNEEIAEDAA
jgi:hypothetical protein